MRRAKSKRSAEQEQPTRPVRRDALFRPGELESTSHVVARDLRGIKGFLRSSRPLIDYAQAKLGLTRVETIYVVLVAALPRPHGRPLGVGLQASNAAKAAVLNVCPRTVQYARARVRELGLVRSYRQLRPVRLITAARKPEHRMTSFTSSRDPLLPDGRPPVEHTQADCYVVDYPTPKLLTLLNAHRPEVRTLKGLWITLWRWLGKKCERFGQLAKRPSEDCVPYNVSDCAKEKAPAPRSHRRLKKKRTADFELSSSDPPCGKPVERSATVQSLDVHERGSRTRYPDGRSRKSQPRAETFSDKLRAALSKVRGDIAFVSRRLTSGSLITGEFERALKKRASLINLEWRLKAALRRRKHARQSKTEVKT